jgi:hypothetical protein
MGFPLWPTLQDILERLPLAQRLADLVRRIAAEFKFRRVRSAVVNVPYSARGSYSATVVDADVSSSTRIIASLATLPETAENGGDAGADLSVQALAGAGSITFLFSGFAYFGGPWTINYQLGA